MTSEEIWNPSPPPPPPRVPKCQLSNLVFYIEEAQVFYPTLTFVSGSQPWMLIITT